ncbi:hypothetical protein GCM10027570_00340 [Streptomonospora sediminis]
MQVVHQCLDAMEDALEPERRLRGGNEVPAALAAYQHARRDRVERIAGEGRKRRAQKAGASHPVALALRDVSMRVAFALIRRFGSQRWITDHRVEPEAGTGGHTAQRR